MRLAVVAGAVVVMAAAWAALQDEQVQDEVSDVVNRVKVAVGGWSWDMVPVEYQGMIMTAEQQYGLPDGMLARLLWQESRYRKDIIEGRTRSSAGALGIAQFMPATAADLGIDPLNVPQAIRGAARYLKTLYNMTGTWAEALAAYNWGIGNVQRKGLAAAPLETRNYYAQIMGDLGMVA